MPSLYTHYRFGQEVLALLPGDLQEIIQKNQKLFNLGLQGPDFFFYASIFGKKEISRFGNDLHDYKGNEIFTSILEQLGAKENSAYGGIDEKHLAYLLGFLGHFVLDTYAHPYVFKVQNTMRDHLALETDYDQYLLAKDGKTPWKVNLGYTVETSQEDREVVADCFASYQEQIAREDVLYAARSIKTLRSLMTLPNRMKSVIYAKALKALKISDDYQAMFIRPPAKGEEADWNWPDRPLDSFEALDNRYERALKEYPLAAEELIRQCEHRSTWSPIFHRDFCEIGSEG